MLLKSNKRLRKIKGKRGDTPGPGLLLALALVIVILGFSYWYFIAKPSKAADLTVSSLLLKSRYDACQQKGETSSGYVDIDEDRFPDDCDNCIRLDANKENKISHNDEDDDNDYMPNGCDSEPNDPSVFACKKDKEWNKNLFPYRCIEK